MNAPAELSIDRRTFIGGSDAAAIFGVSPWATRLDIYLRKRGEMPATGGEPDAKREKILRRGKRLEPIVIDMLIEEHGIKVTKRSTPQSPNRYADPEHPFMAAEIDFEWEVTAETVAHFAEEGYEIDPALIGTVQNGEVKTVHPFASKKYGEEGTDEIPIEYAAQCAHGQMVSGKQLTMVVVLVGADNLLVYWMRRDDELIREMRARELAFWNDNVLRGVPPAPYGLKDIYHLFGRKTASSIEASAAVADAVQELIRLSNVKATAEHGIEEVKFRIGTFMLGAEEMEKPSKPGVHALTVAGQPILTVALQSATRIDQKALKERYPDIAADCTKSTSHFVFRPKRSK